MGNRRLYDQDFYAWASEQAGLLRAGRLSEADIEHIAEEIESMGRSEKRELVNRLTVLLLRLLKWRYLPVLRGSRWRLTLEEQRNQIRDHLADNPSLKSMLAETTATAYRNAVLGGAREIGMDRNVFPGEFPWSFERIMDLDFYSEATN